AASDHQPAVRAKRDPPDFSWVLHWQADRLARPGVPDARRPVRAGRGHPAAIEAEHRLEHPSCLGTGSELPPGCGLPDRPTPSGNSASSEDPPASRTEASGDDWVGATDQCAEPPAGGGLPYRRFAGLGLE